MSEQERIDCGEAAKRLWAFLDAELPPPSAEEVDAHLGKCGKCVEVTEAQRAFLEKLADLTCEDDAATIALRERIRALLREDERA